MDFRNLRREYSHNRLHERILNSDPFNLFNLWLKKAIDSEAVEANAMTLATARLNGVPSSRTVLLKDIDENGLIFFTNYNSKKAREIDQNPSVSVTFWWHSLCRQITILGSASKTTQEQSESYFRSRPRGSQIGAWTSDQDAIIPSHRYLENRFREMEERFKDNEIPLPPHWGGYCIKPTEFEFWQGRENRLHDRFRYQINELGKRIEWKIDRLSP